MNLQGAIITVHYREEEVEEEDFIFHDTCTNKI